MTYIVNRYTLGIVDIERGISMTFNEYKENFKKDHKLFEHENLNDYVIRQEGEITEFGLRYLFEISSGLINPINIYNVPEIKENVVLFNLEKLISIEIPLDFQNLFAIITAREIEDIPDNLQKYTKSTKIKGHCENIINEFENAKDEGERILLRLEKTPSQFKLGMYEFIELRSGFNGFPKEQVEFLVSNYKNYHKYTMKNQNYFLSCFHDIVGNVPSDSKYSPKSLKLNVNGNVTVYRGVSSESLPMEMNPISWTTRLDVAEKYATKSGENGIIYIGEARIEDISAYIGGNDFEVIIPTSNLDCIYNYLDYQAYNEQFPVFRDRRIDL